MSIRHIKKIISFVVSIMIGIGVVTVRAENIDPDNDDSQYAYSENAGISILSLAGKRGSGAGN